MNGSWSETNEQQIALYFGELTTWNYVVYSFIMLCGTVANCLLLFAIYRDPLKCFRNSTTIFILNLAISDLLNNCVNLSELFLSLTNAGGVYGLSDLCGKMVMFSFDCSFYSTFPCVFSMAVERYLAISRPLWHKVYVTRHICRSWIVALWLFIFACAGTGIALRNSIYHNAVLSCFMLLFFFGTIIIYFFAFLSVRRQRQAIDNIISEVTYNIVEVRLKNQSNFLKTIFIVNVILIFGLLPSMLFLVSAIQGDIFTSDDSIAMELLFHMLDISFVVNYAINPFLYYMRLQKYRKTFLILCWKKAL